MISYLVIECDIKQDISDIELEIYFEYKVIKRKSSYFIRVVDGKQYVLIADSHSNNIVLGTSVLEDLDVVFSYNVNHGPANISFIGLPGFDKHRTSNIIVLCVASGALLVIFILLIKKICSKDED